MEHTCEKTPCAKCREPYREKQRQYIQSAFKRLNPAFVSNLISK